MLIGRTYTPHPAAQPQPVHEPITYTPTAPPFVQPLHTIPHHLLAQIPPSGSPSPSVRPIPPPRRRDHVDQSSTDAAPGQSPSPQAHVLRHRSSMSLDGFRVPSPHPTISFTSPSSANPTSTH